MSRLMHRLTGKWPEPDYEAMHSSTEALGFALEEIAELYERVVHPDRRAAADDARHRHLRRNSCLPGLHSAHAFAWVMVLIVASGALTLAILFWRRLL